MSSEYIGAAYKFYRRKMLELMLVSLLNGGLKDEIFPAYQAAVVSESLKTGLFLKKKSLR